jgi:hypothetical protein
MKRTPVVAHSGELRRIAPELIASTYGQQRNPAWDDDLKTGRPPSMFFLHITYGKSGSVSASLLGGRRKVTECRVRHMVRVQIQSPRIVRPESLYQILRGERPASRSTSLDPRSFVNLVAERGDLGPCPSRDGSDIQRCAPVQAESDYHVFCSKAAPCRYIG